MTDEDDFATILHASVDEEIADQTVRWSNEAIRKVYALIDTGIDQSSESTEIEIFIADGNVRHLVSEVSDFAAKSGQGTVETNIVNDTFHEIRPLYRIWPFT